MLTVSSRNKILFESMAYFSFYNAISIFKAFER